MKNASPEFQWFIKATLNAMCEDGFDSYLPTLAYGETVSVLEGVPAVAEAEGRTHRIITENWIKKVKPNLPYMVAYLDGRDWAYALRVTTEGIETYYIERRGNKLHSRLISDEA